MQIDNKKFYILAQTVAALIYLALSYHLFTVIDSRYEKAIPQIFWAFLFVLFIIAFSIERNRKKKALTISTAFLFILVQGLVLLIPKLHEFVYNLFAWSSF